MSRSNPRDFLYGRQAVRESLRAGRRRPFCLYIVEGLKPTPIINDIIGAAKQAHIPHRTLPRHDLARLVHTEAHQGVALETSAYPYTPIEAIFARAQAQQRPPLMLILDLLQDVHNVGSLLRAAEAAGVHGVLLQERRAASITPDTVNTSSGAAEHLHIARVTNLARTLATLKERGLWLAGLEGVPVAQPYTTVDMTVPLGIIVGSEGQGVRRLVREQCDWLIALPMYGQIESLNAATAGAIALYEVVRQRNANVKRDT